MHDDSPNSLGEKNSIQGFYLLLLVRVYAVSIAHPLGVVVCTAFDDMLTIGPYLLSFISSSKWLSRVFHTIYSFFYMVTENTSAVHHDTGQQIA